MHFGVLDHSHVMQNKKMAVNNFVPRVVLEQSTRVEIEVENR